MRRIKNTRKKGKRSIKRKYRKQKGGNLLSILYLIITDKGLPEIYNYIRDKSLVLSYKEETPDTKIFLPNSSWTDSRNKLREYALNLSEKYDYYIFIDNDIQFKDFSQEEGFKRFEEKLNIIKPVIGIPRYLNFPDDPIIKFDPCMNAFCKEIFMSDKIFPYDNKFDSISWFVSGYILQIKIYYYYNNRVTIFDDIIIINNNHSSYPNEWTFELRKQSYDYIMNIIPQVLKDEYGSLPIQ